jgi:predicted 2-oxoglutarate/Fe(II)-dependent dioxygenase YbiX/peroxiredoxin
MNETTTTQDFGTFGIGDRLRPFGFRDHNGQQTNLDGLTLAGKPVVVFVCPLGMKEQAKTQFAGFATAAPDLFKLGASLLLIGAYTLPEIDGFFGGVPSPFPVLADPQGEIPKFLGLGALRAPMTLVAGPDLRVKKVITGSASHAAEALAAVTELCRPVKHCRVAGQAPVLLISDVLSPAECARVIQFWESQQKHFGIVGTAKGGVQTYDTTIKRRWDVPVEDPAMRAELDALVQRRVLGEIKKAFHFVVRTGETMKIGCYDAEQQGFFRAHRDNNDPQVAHRRFAMSLNLNEGYEGGGVRFPEFPGAEYRPAAGEALVFSCSLLHEVQPVTKGRRFGIFGFYW